MANAKRDFGVVLSLIGSGTTTGGYIAPNNTSGTPKIAASGVFRASDTFLTGVANQTSISVYGNVGATAFGCVVGVERQRYDQLNSGQTKWSLVGTSRLDQQVSSGGIYSGTGGAVPPRQFQTLLATDFSGFLVDSSPGSLLSGGTSGERLAVTLVTVDALNATGGARVIARPCSGTFSSGDYLFFAVEAGG